MMQRKAFLLGVCLLLTSSAHAQTAPTPPKEPRYFAIKGARIVPVSGAAIDDGTVVIANGLIAAVGKDVTIPPEAWVIDGKGMTVYPGLIDALTDLGLQGPRPTGGAGGPGQSQLAQPAQPAQQQQQPGQQAIRSEGPLDRPGTQPWRAAADELRNDDRRLEQWRNAGFTSALAQHRAGIFAGQGAVINLAGEDPRDMVVKTPATLLISLQPTGGLFAGFPGSLMGVISYVKQVYDDTQQYAAANAAYSAKSRGTERPMYDRTVRVMEQAQREGWPTLIPGNNPQQIIRAMELARKVNARAVLYGGQQAYDVTGEIAAEKLPVLVSLRWPERDRNADPEQEDSLETLRFRDRAPSSPAALEKAGVKWAFYSDGITNVADIRRNVRRAIEAGLSADAALKGLTWNAAEILGVSDRLGSIEPGKIANLTVTDGDLFAERTRVKMVFIDGKKFDVREAPPGGERETAAERPSEEVRP